MIARWSARPHYLWPSHLELWHQPPWLQVQRMLIEIQLPVHHLLVVQLKFNIAARGHMDLCFKGFHVLGISPVKQKKQKSLTDKLHKGVETERLFCSCTWWWRLPCFSLWPEHTGSWPPSSPSLSPQTLSHSHSCRKYKVQLYLPLSLDCLHWVNLGSHGEVGDESSFWDLDVEGDALGIGAWIDHRAPDDGVGKAWRDAAFHFVAPDSDVISTDGLCRQWRNIWTRFWNFPDIS